MHAFEEVSGGQLITWYRFPWKR